MFFSHFCFHRCNPVSEKWFWFFQCLADRPKIFLSSPVVIYLDVTCLNVLSTFFLVYLSLLQEFYGEKKNLQMGMPEDLPETFERWAEMLRLKLLAYQRQTDDYYNVCLGGKFIQLRLSFSCIRNFSVSKLKIAVTKNYVIVIIHHTQWKNSSWLYWKLRQYSFLCIISYKKCSRRALD